MNTINFIDIIISDYDISVKFVKIKYAECDDTLQTEFETTTSRFSRIVTDTYFLPRIQYKHYQNHMETLSRVPCKQRLYTWTHGCYSLVEKGPVAQPVW